MSTSKKMSLKKGEMANWKRLPHCKKGKRFPHPGWGLENRLSFFTVHLQWFEDLADRRLTDTKSTTVLKEGTLHIREYIVTRLWRNRLSHRRMIWLLPPPLPTPTPGRLSKKEREEGRKEPNHTMGRKPVTLYNTLFSIFRLLPSCTYKVTLPLFLLYPMCTLCSNHRTLFLDGRDHRTILTAKKTIVLSWGPEPVILNVYGAQESIPRNAFRQPM
jgi:hypothetical protein